MNLLKEYIKLSENRDAFNCYFRCANRPGIHGNMFYFRQTSFRNLMDFKYSYNIFKLVDGIDRSKWEKSASYNQQLDKHRTVRMFGSKLFSKNERTYYITEKGTVMQKIIDNEHNFSEQEQWLLVYFLILDSYFDNKINYILNRTKYVFENIIASGIEEEDIIIAIKDIIANRNKKMKELISQDYLFMDTFFEPYSNDYDFLSIYNDSSDLEKQELYEYIKKNLTNRTSNCIISKKYEPQGNYTKNMLIDNAKILFMTQNINNMSSVSFKEFIYNSIEKYKEIEEIDEGKILKFIFTNKDIFEIIYFNIFNIDYLDIEKPETDEEDEDLPKDEKIDDTSVKNIEKLKRISNVLKKKAKERTNYKCELEDFCGCDKFYFTSKETKHNYLEIHHFIPREFSNEFEHSIEVIENYIALCPRCHRMIHLAVDRERKTLINAIYNKRKQSLKNKGLEISLKEIEKFYNIED